jgi:hypothetical protein
MRKSSILVLNLFMQVTFVLSQNNDTLNKLNLHRKKQGYWVCYLDARFMIADSSDAIYAAFDLYDNGQNLTQIGIRSNRIVGEVVDSIFLTGPKLGRFKLLHGKVRFYHNNGLLAMEEKYSLGHPVIYLGYDYYKTHSDSCIGTISEYIDFTKKYNNINGSYYNEITICPQNEVKKFWFIKVKRKWRSVKIKN